MRRVWNRLDNNTKLALGCMALYLSLYIVVDAAEALAALLV